MFESGTSMGISPMITSMKSTHGSVPFRHSVVRLYGKYSTGGVNMKDSSFHVSISGMRDGRSFFLTASGYISTPVLHPLGYPVPVINTIVCR